MARNYWYVARPDELLIDLDHRSAKLDKLANAGQRLRGAIEDGSISVRDVWLYPSRTEKHYHLIIRLKYEISFTEREAWSIYLRSDIYRAVNNLMRGFSEISNPVLIIANHQWKDFYRMADAICGCRTKHDHATMKKCPAAKFIRGDFRTTEFFGHPSKRGIKWTFGKVQL